MQTDKCEQICDWLETFLSTKRLTTLKRKTEFFDELLLHFADLYNNKSGKMPTNLAVEKRLILTIHPDKCQHSFATEASKCKFRNKISLLIEKIKFSNYSQCELLNDLMAKPSVLVINIMVKSRRRKP